MMNLIKYLGLELGADDYMTKPFSPREVIARVKAVLRRFSSPIVEEVSEQGELSFNFGDLQVYPERFEVFLEEETLDFTPKEFELLVYLLENKNRVLTRDQLLSAVWNYDFAGDTRIVDVHISHLRDKIEENSRKPKFIKTIRGLGYKFEEPKNNEITNESFILFIYFFSWIHFSCPRICHRSAFSILRE